MSHVNKCPRCTSEGHVHVDEQSVGNKPNLLDIEGTRLPKKIQKHNNTHGTGINMRKHAHKAIRLLQAICSHEKLLEGCRALEGLRWMVKGVCL